MLLLNILLGFFVAAVLFNAVYYLLVLSKFKLIKTVVTHTEPAVSVIICSRDHGFELNRKLEKVLTQDYSNYEVIVVDDFSTDETRDILLDLKIKYPHLRPIFLGDMKKEHFSKKDAMTTGVLFAKHEILVLTDADCEPMSNNWVKSIITGYSDPSVEIVLGYGKYQKEKGLLNKLIRFDAFIIAMQYMFLAKAGIPYMGVGRNLSYKKTLFLKNQGFYKHLKLDSGDDDLFIQQNGHKKNVAVVHTEESFTLSTPKMTFWNWIRQKVRHTTTAKYYKIKHKTILFFLNFFKYGELIAFIALNILSFNQPLILQIIWTLFIFKICIQYFVMYKMSRIFREQDLLVYSILFEIMLFFIYPLFIFGKYFIKHART